MTIIEGQVETLKHLKRKLEKSGITRFSSVGEISSFIKSYELEKEQLPLRIGRELDVEIKAAQTNLTEHQQSLNRLESSLRQEIQEQIHALDAALKRTKKKSENSSLFRVIFFPHAFFLARKASRLDKNSEKIVRRKAKSSRKMVALLERDVDHLLRDRDNIAAKRCEKSLKELTYTKQVVDGLTTLVAGAIGEMAVVNTLQPLPDDYYLINDFSLQFDRPIFNRKENDRIYSIQIDHLLICKAGVFLLETKNWSKNSIQRLDLRSPVKQIRRTSFALFVLLNGDSRRKRLKLRRHHWGEKKIPIRNLIVMINSKPAEEFKYVKVLSLNELVGYVKYFDQVFDDEEVKRIFDFLRAQM